MFRAGFCAIVGLPNVGKSTLMNRLLGQKIAIASPRPQTTRNRLLGVKNLPSAQLALVDTPGLHRPGGRRRSELNRYMVGEVHAALAHVDAVLMIVEAPSGALAKKLMRAGQPLGDDPQFLLEAVKHCGKPAVLAINKIDLLGDKSLLLPLLDGWSKALAFRAMVPVSAQTGEGVDRLEPELEALLPVGERIFPEDMITDRAERWLAAELVREQVFVLTRHEVPYSVAVTIDNFEERASDVHIDATVHVEKEAQKRILVGEGGRMVREIGSRARREIGQLLGCEAHLKLFVRVAGEWTSTRGGLGKMGYE